MISPLAAALVLVLVLAALAGSAVALYDHRAALARTAVRIAARGHGRHNRPFTVPLPARAAWRLVHRNREAAA